MTRSWFLTTVWRDYTKFLLAAATGFKLKQLRSCWHPEHVHARTGCTALPIQFQDRAVHMNIYRLPILLDSAHKCSSQVHFHLHFHHRQEPIQLAYTWLRALANKPETCKARLQLAQGSSTKFRSSPGQITPSLPLRNESWSRPSLKTRFTTCPPFPAYGLARMAVRLIRWHG